MFDSKKTFTGIQILFTHANCCKLCSPILKPFCSLPQLADMTGIPIAMDAKAHDGLYFTDMQTVRFKMVSIDKTTQ